MVMNVVIELQKHGEEDYILIPCVHVCICPWKGGRLVR
jgi:hypothetical protein